MRILLRPLLLAALIAAAGPALAADIAAEKAAIRKIDKQWVEAVAAKDVAATTAFYAKDGTILPPGAPAATGPEAIAKVWDGFFKLKGFRLTFAPTHIEVAKSADIAYEIGTYSLAFDGDKGPVQDEGKYVVAWKKVGKTWKATADIFNSNGPAK